MKIPIFAFVLLALVAVSLRAQSPANQSQIAVPAPTPYTIVSQDANSRVWQRQEYEAGPNGEIVTNTHSYTELATGLNHLVNGQFVASSEQINILPDGSAAATQGQHQVYFPADILNGNIRSIGPDGVQLISQPSAIVEYDGTNTAFIAILTNSVGQVVDNNQLLYTNAFEGIRCDILYEYTKAGFEQNIVLRQRVPDPASLGLNPASTRLQVLTEFIDTAQPILTGSSISDQAGVTLTGEELSFGVMRMVQGKAFVLPSGTPTAVVSKSWMIAGSRQFLVEEVPFMAIAAQLQALSASAAKPGHALWASKGSHKLVLPPRHIAKMAKARLTLAKVNPLKQSGVILDYQTINTSQTNYTFQSDTTYLISGAVNLFNTNVFEGGSVIKYATNGSITISGSGQSIIWEGGPYRPVVFTAVDDNSVGVSLGSGTPSGYYGNPMLFLHSLGSSSLTGMRFCYAQTAIWDLFANANIYDAQFVNCENGLTIGGASLFVGNALFANTLTNLIFASNGSASANIQNSTLSGSAYLATAPTFQEGIKLAMTNCIVANVTNIVAGLLVSTNGNYNGSYNSGSCSSLGFVTSAPQYPFQTVGAGNFYLLSGGSFHNAGSTNIDPYLFSSLSQRTTYPPLIVSNSITSSSTTLVPQAERDNSGFPDLGYSYDPIDYIVDNYWFTNCTLTLADGVVVACYNDSGFIITDGSSVNSTGSALNPNIVTSYQTAQEEPISISMNGYGPSQTVPFNTYHLAVAPNGQFNFTTFTCLAGGGYHIYQGSAGFTYASLNVQNSQFWGGQNQITSGTGLMAKFDNNLFVRSTVSSLATLTSSMSFTNNLFWGASSIVFRDPSFSRLFAFNNDFDSCTITTYTTNCINGYNAFLNCNTQLFPTNGTAYVSASALNYETGFLGMFYQPTNSPLIQMGSTTANYLGLYHFTTQTNQVPETNAIVTIGYHYVATDTNGVPLDSNGDGIPDYIEDANGNGLADSGEIGWNLTNDLGLQVIISQPANAASLP